MSCCLTRCPTVETVSNTVSNHSPTRPSRTNMDMENDVCDTKTAEMAPTKAGVWFSSFTLGGHKISGRQWAVRVRTMGMDKLPPEDSLLVLKIPKALLEGEKTEKEASLWQSLRGNQGLDSVKPALPEALQVSDGTETEWLAATSAFLTENANEPHYREVASTLASGYPCIHTKWAES